MLQLLEYRRLLQRAGPPRQPHYYPAKVGGAPFDATRHYHRFAAPYGLLVRLTDEAGPLLQDQLLDLSGWTVYNVVRLLHQAVEDGALRPAAQLDPLVRAFVAT